MSATVDGRVRFGGWSIVAGRESRRGTVEFRAFEPAVGRDSEEVYHAASPEDVDGACRAAAEAFEFTRHVSGERRARLLEGAADRVERMGDGLVELASRETGLEARPRLEGELRRTVFTLRMFAGVAREGRWTRTAVDPGDPARTPTPKPELRSVLRPLGPVAVFGAGNFPLAYSTAGGDTASALAAGCPVIVKGHPGHPGTGEAVAWAVCEAAVGAGFPAGVFSFLHAGGEREMQVGTEVVLHPAVRAVGFTGSFGGGMALAELARGREEPIPVFAEMGSVNPVFVLPGAMRDGGAWGAERIGALLAASVANSHGQMCTCPGLVFAVRGGDADRLVRALAEGLRAAGTRPMLGRRGWEVFARRIGEVSRVPGVERVIGEGEPRGPGVRSGAVALRCGLAALRANPTLGEECFGPSTIVVECAGVEEMVEGAGLVRGSLTGAIFADDADREDAIRLRDALERRVGRLIFNGVPTGVEVSEAMVHGGPWPATNQPHTTAVGARAIERWCRPVCYQNAPAWSLRGETK